MSDNGKEVHPMSDEAQKEVPLKHPKVVKKRSSFEVMTSQTFPIFMAIVRLFVAFYTFILGSMQLALGTNPLVKNYFRLDYPKTYAFIFFMTSLIHMHGAINIIRRKDDNIMFARLSRVSARNSQKSAPGKCWSSVIRGYLRTLGPDGMFGRRGKFIGVRLVIRECIDIPLQTYQAYLLAEEMTSPTFSILYASVIAIDCVLVPIIMKAGDAATLQRLNKIMFVDILVDLILGVILPLSLLLGPIGTFVSNPRVTTDFKFIDYFASAVSRTIASSHMGLAIAVVPLLSLDHLMDDLFGNWRDLQKGSVLCCRDSLPPINKYEAKDVDETKSNEENEKKKSENHRIKGFLDWPMIDMHGVVVAQPKNVTVSIGGAFSVFWGLGFLIAALRAPAVTDCSAFMTDGICSHAVAPWYAESGECYCRIVDLHFDHNPKLQALDTWEKQDAYMNKLFRESFADKGTRLLTVSNAKWSKLPDYFLDMSELGALDSNGNYHLTDFPEEGLASYFPRMAILTLFGMDSLKEIPESFRELPPLLAGFGIGSSQFMRLPEWSGKWTVPVFMLSLSVNATDFPMPVTEMTAIAKLYIRNAGIKSIPPQITNLKSLIYLDMSNNSITTLPTELGTMTQIKELFLGGNDISDAKLPFGLDTMDWKNPSWAIKELRLSGNPVCDKRSGDGVVDYSKTKACEVLCGSPLCTNFYMENLWCDPGCNTEACGWDNGACVKIPWQVEKGF